jgi:2-methylcitrate dehydratase PrpD
MLKLKREHDLRPSDVAAIELEVPTRHLGVCNLAEPKTGLEGKFSLPYVLAAGVLDGAYGLGTFTDEAVGRAQIHALYEKIAVKEEERCGGYDPLLATRPAGARGFVEVEVVTTDGRSETMCVENAPGHPKNPLGWDDIRQKFLDCARHGGVPVQRAEYTFQALQNLERCEDVEALSRLLTLDAQN